MPAWYFIDGTTIPLAVYERIPAAMRILGGLRGFVVPASHRDDILPLLGWAAGTVQEIPTSAWDTLRLVPADQLPEAPPADVFLKHTGKRPAAWREYLECVAEWCREQPLPQSTVIHYGPAKHEPNGDGHLHLCFGGSASFAEQEQLHGRDVHYQCGNLWVGELGPEHEDSKSLIPKILDPLFPRIAVRRYRNFRVDIVPHEEAAAARPLLEEWAQRICRDIVLDVPHGRAVAPENDGRMHIHIFSRQKNVGAADPRRFRTCFGNMLPDGCGDGLQPSPGADVLTDGIGQVFAEVGGSAGLHLYLLFDLTHTWGALSATIFHQCLTTWLNRYGLRTEESRYIAHLEHLKEVGREDFLTHGVELHQKRVVEVAGDVRHTQERVAATQQALVDAIREEEAALRDLADVQVQAGEERARLATVFDELLKSPRVRFVRYQNGTISVYTTRVYIVVQGRNPTENGIYDIGDFRVDLYTSGGDGCVRMINLTRHGPNNYHHPHADVHGKPCLGSLKEAIPRLIAKREYVTAVDLLLQYLHSVRPDDPWGRRVFEWPKF